MRHVLTAACLLLLGLTAAAFGGTATIPATADLFSAGQSAANTSRGGTLPIEIDLPSGVNRTIQFSGGTGQVMAGPNVWPLVGLDGGTTMALGTRPTDLNSASGISGLQAPNFQFLSGVFLDANTPVAGTEPARLNFNLIGMGFTSLTPLVHQSFFIGDGLTGTGSGQVQTFNVPDSASRLFLGIEDGYDFKGDPSQYQDNTGSFSIQYTIVPEPTGMGLIPLGILLLTGATGRAVGRKHSRGNAR